MTKEEAIEEINKVFEPAFANYIITALTEGATTSDKASEQEPILVDETEVITNQEWLAHIAPEEWVRVIHWLYHDYGTRFTHSEGAIIKWLRQDMREEQT